ncbi:MAG: hypothetical protein KIT51_10085 [Cyclobacteriaceae bacterium]|nr:MAG: hypothetical protein KIT51_10085 [Cyclobacteriaceae bacterium]
MKNTNTKINFFRLLLLLLLPLSFSIISCGDNEDDTKSSNPNEITIGQLSGLYKTTSVVFNGKTITDACDVNWPNGASNMRRIDLNFKGGANNFTDLINYRCVSGSTVSNVINDNITSLTNNELNLDGAYRFKVISFNNGILKLELLSTTAITTPIGAVYTMSK